MDKRERSALFRNRVVSALDASGLSRSALARETHVERSTISQLLGGDTPRLPNGQLVADLAGTLGVSADWLLGLTDRPERPGDLMAAAMAMSPAERSSADAQLLEWHHEAAGYKVRHVPATLPDILKTPEILEWEYSGGSVAGAGPAIDAMRNQLEWLRSGVSDYEIALSVHEVRALAGGSGYYHDADATIRAEQLQRIARLCRDIYPRLRLFLFDSRRVFSAPVTVFGPHLAVVYIGQFHLAFREGQRVNSLRDHFDWLVREATVDAREAADFVEGLPLSRPNGL